MLGICGGSRLGDAIRPAVVGVPILVLGWRAILFEFGLVGLASAAGLYLVLSASMFETRPAGERTDSSPADAAL